MVQKQSTRSRSKSSSRKTTPETTDSNPILASPKKPVKSSEKKPDRVIDNSFQQYRRVTRQSIRATASSSLDDWEVTDPITNEEINQQNKSMNKAANVDLLKEGFLCSRRRLSLDFINAALSIVFVILFPILVILLNKMSEIGGELRLISLSEIKLEYFVNWISLGLVTLWLLFLSLLSVLPIGSARSVALSDGFQLRYRCNGTLSLTVSAAGLAALLYTQLLSTELIYDHYYSLIGSSIVLTFIISSIVYLKSFLKTAHLVTNSGNVPYCFLMGREINPRIFGLDLKYFYEFRPGFISWALLNIVFCVRDWESNDYRQINLSLLLCAACQFVYCFDSLLFEGDIISKSFMISGRFGFLHCFGSQVIVPFLFTLTTRVIQINKLEISPKYLACIAILNFFGYVVYRASNSQKNEFRRNPYSVHLSHLKTITTDKGRQLLAGGWWGVLRHPNYAGDVIMSISWSLCAGCHLSICWFYPLYFIIFIVSRCLQDEQSCYHRHGDAWRKYTQMVPYRLLPFIF